MDQKTIKMISATTHVDAHNQRIARSALEKSAEDINTGKKPVLTVMHDVAIPPIGKMLSATVEPREDGEYQLVVEAEIFEGTLWVETGSGRLFRDQSATNSTAFVDKYTEFPSEQFTVAVDDINFESSEDASLLLRW